MHWRIIKTLLVKEVHRQLANRGGVAGMDVPKKFFGLTVQLIEVGPDGQTTDRHDEPPSTGPGSAGVGQRRFGDHVRTSGDLLQVDSVLSADGRRPARPSSSYPRNVRYASRDTRKAS